MEGRFEEKGRRANGFVVDASVWRNRLLPGLPASLAAGVCAFPSCPAAQLLPVPSSRLQGNSQQRGLALGNMCFAGKTYSGNFGSSWSRPTLASRRQGNCRYILSSSITACLTRTNSQIRSVVFDPRSPFIPQHQATFPLPARSSSRSCCFAAAIDNDTSAAVNNGRGFGQSSAIVSWPRPLVFALSRQSPHEAISSAASLASPFNVPWRRVPSPAIIRHR